MVDRSGPLRWINGVNDYQKEQLAEWLEAIREDGADIDEAIERLKTPSRKDVSPEKRFPDSGDEVKQVPPEKGDAY